MRRAASSSRAWPRWPWPPPAAEPAWSQSRPAPRPAIHPSRASSRGDEPLSTVANCCQPRTAASHSVIWTSEPAHTSARQPRVRLPNESLLWRTIMNQDWNFAPAGPAVLAPPGPKPTPRRFRKLLRREEENLASVLPNVENEPAAAPEVPKEPSGRDARGRFTAGNKGGTGNPFARQIAGFRKALANAVTPERFERIAHAPPPQAHAEPFVA